MVYTLQLSNYTNYYKMKLKKGFKIIALQRLRYFPINTTEKILDEYLKTNFKISLMQACYLIISACKIEEEKDTLVVSMLNTKLDNIARIITFGTGKVLGSRIIPFILGKS